MTHPTRNTLPALLGVGLITALTLLPGAALAGHGDAFVEIDNQFDGPAQVWLDGRLQATVRGDSRIRLETRPGMHSLVVQRAETGFVLRSERVHLSPRTTTLLRVEAPMSTLRISNPSEASLRVTAGRQDVWISPNTMVELSVRSGNVSLVATTRGDERVHDRVVWVEPGRRSLTTLDYVPPTRFIVYNHHPYRVRVVVDGRELEQVGPGAQEWVQVRAGTHLVQMFHGARLVDSTSLRLTSGQQRTVITGSAPSSRPAPPPRLTSYEEPAICPVTGRPLTIASR